MGLQVFSLVLGGKASLPPFCGPLGLPCTSACLLSPTGASSATKRQKRQVQNLNTFSTVADGSKQRDLKQVIFMFLKSLLNNGKLRNLLPSPLLSYNGGM